MNHSCKGPKVGRLLALGTRGAHLVGALGLGGGKVSRQADSQVMEGLMGHCKVLRFYCQMDGDLTWGVQHSTAYR